MKRTPRSRRLQGHNSITVRSGIAPFLLHVMTNNTRQFTQTQTRKQSCKPPPVVRDVTVDCHVTGGSDVTVLDMGSGKLDHNACRHYYVIWGPSLRNVRGERSREGVDVITVGR